MKVIGAIMLIGPQPILLVAMVIVALITACALLPMPLPLALLPGMPLIPHLCWRMRSPPANLPRQW